MVGCSLCLFGCLFVGWFFGCLVVVCLQSLFISSCLFSSAAQREFGWLQSITSCQRVAFSVFNLAAKLLSTTLTLTPLRSTLCFCLFFCFSVCKLAKLSMSKLLLSTTLTLTPLRGILCFCFFCCFFFCLPSFYAAQAALVSDIELTPLKGILCFCFFSFCLLFFSLTSCRANVNHVDVDTSDYSSLIVNIEVQKT